MTFKIRVFFMVLLFAAKAESQTNYNKQIEQLMGQLRSGQVITIDKGTITSGASYKTVYPTLSAFFSDTVFSVRLEALSISSDLALKAGDAESVKRSARDVLGNCIYKGSLHAQLVSLLKRYKRSDFGPAELELMKKQLDESQANLGMLAKIYAFAAPQGSSESSLLNLLSRDNLSKADKKDIKLALIRSGDTQLAETMNSKLKEMVINDELIYSGLDDIIYTRNKLLYTYLLNAILKNEKKCTSANNDDNSYITCAYRLMERLAPVIKDFPASVNKNGELVTKNPEETLATVRSWIEKNRNSFGINTDRY